MNDIVIEPIGMRIPVLTLDDEEVKELLQIFETGDFTVGTVVTNKGATYYFDIVKYGMFYPQQIQWYYDRVWSEGGE